ncbi:MAG: hypothetical protein KAX80_08340 [Planctomycetes bacterium]|nr:hypothetical protein [Planctomycetota bacterium]
MNVKWRNVLIAALAIVAMAYSRWIAAVVRSIRLGEVGEDFAWEIQRMPPLGRFTAVLMVLALLYITVYMLLLNWVRRG